MNRVIIMRQAIVKIGQMLSAKNVQVTMRGSQAFVLFNKHTHEPERINVPYLPDEAPEDLLDAVQGFLDHEVAHVLFSDVKMMELAHKENLKFTHNVVDDAYIENHMSGRFRGSAENLRRTGGFFIKTVIEPDLAKRPEFTEEILFMPAIRAWAGQSVWADFMQDKWALIPDLVKCAGTDIPERLKNMSTQQEVLDIAREITARRKKAAPQQPQPQPPQQSKEKPNKSDEKQPGKKGEPGPGDDGDEQGESKGKGKNDEDQEKKEQSASDSSTEGDENTDDEEASSGEAAPGSDEEGSDEDSEGDAGDTGEGSGEGDDDDDGKNASGTSEGDEEDDNAEVCGNSGSGSQKGESENEQRPGSDDQSDQAASEGNGQVDEGEEIEHGQPQAAEDTDPQTPKDIEDALSKLKTAAERMNEKLSETVVDASKGVPYLVWSKDFDKIEPLDTRDFEDGMLKDLQEATDHMVAPMQKDLERMIAARSAAVWTGGHRRGKLHGAGLSRLMTGDDRVFRRKQENHTKDVAVSLLVDCSGSMCGQQIIIASRAAYAIASTLERLQINCEVLAFTTGYSLPKEFFEEQAKTKLIYARSDTIHIPIIKSFAERVSNVEIKKRFALLPHSRHLFRENVDGESVEIAATRLAVRSEKRKILMVFSDGMPACNGVRPALSRHLKEVVARLPAAGIESLGIGIEAEAPRLFYPKYALLNDVADLPKLVMGEMKKLLAV